MECTKLPSYVKEVLCRLEDAGFEAYVVGGCVRDDLLGLKPTDYDIATSATPIETKSVFPLERTIDIGMKHGTVGVVFPQGVVEITTFRLDGTYSDARHPQDVSFVASLEEDLKRRDFTINAMAYSPRRGLIDLHGGEKDLQNKTIRCVGDPQKRFSEDALRIIRAIRFASTLGFQLDDSTKKAALDLRDRLKYVARERVSVEFVKMLCGKNVKRVLLDMIDVVGTFIPQVLDMKGFAQKNPHHIYDVLEHTAVVVENVPSICELRLAAFLHDIGKPSTFTLDATGVGHFYGHAKKSIEIATEVLSLLRIERNVMSRTLLLIEWHDRWIEPKKSSIKRAMSKLTPEPFFALLDLKRADNLAQHPDFRDRLLVYDQIQSIAEEIMNEKQCFSLKDLAINGDDLIRLGVSPGKEIGEILNILLEDVIEERVANVHDVLLNEVKKRHKKSEA